MHKTHIATILRALQGKRPINWLVLIWEAFSRAKFATEKKKVDLTAPYYFHLYYAHKLLTKKERRNYEHYSFGIQKLHGMEGEAESQALPLRREDEAERESARGEEVVEQEIEKELPQEEMRQNASMAPPPTQKEKENVGAIEAMETGRKEKAPVVFERREKSKRMLFMPTQSPLPFVPVRLEEVAEGVQEGARPASSMVSAIGGGGAQNEAIVVAMEEGDDMVKLHLTPTSSGQRVRA